jgi:hypothetical protein
MRGITGITAPFKLSIVWTLFFATSRLHRAAATTGNPSFFPQVRTVLPSALHFYLFNALQDYFFFDWNPPGTTVPIPITRIVHFLVKGLPVY